MATQKKSFTAAKPQKLLFYIKMYSQKQKTFLQKPKMFLQKGPRKFW